MTPRGIGKPGLRAHAADTQSRTKGWASLWARDWALGPSGGRGVPPYVSRVESGTGKEEAGYGNDTETQQSAGVRPAEPGGEHHERPDAEDRRCDPGASERLE